MFISSMMLREKKNKEVLSDGARKWKRTDIPVFYKGCFRSSCVYYINMYFSLFSVKIYVKCIDEFRIVYFEFYAQWCSKKAFVKCVCTLYKSPLTWKSFLYLLVVAV